MRSARSTRSRDGKAPLPSEQDSSTDKAQAASRVATAAANKAQAAATALLAPDPAALDAFQARTDATPTMAILSSPNSLTGLSTDSTSLTSSPLASSSSSSSQNLPGSSSSSSSSHDNQNLTGSGSSSSSSSHDNQNLPGIASSSSSSSSSSSHANQNLPGSMSLSLIASSPSSSSSSAVVAVVAEEPYRKFDLSVLEEVELYRFKVETTDGTATTFMRSVRDLLSERGSETYLKARPVLQTRIDVWIIEFQKMGFMGSNAVCAKLVINKYGQKELWIFVSTYVLLMHTHMLHSNYICISIPYISTQDGNHRVHALKELLALPVHLRPHFLALDDYMIPVNIYTEAMPDGLAIRYGRLMNELQAIAFNANFLDDARYITNIRSTITCAGENTEEKAYSLVNSAISLNASKYTTLQKEGLSEGRITFSDEYVKRLIAMKHFLGNVCFDYAEGLQEMNKTDLIDRLQQLDANMITLPNGARPKYAEDCFMPHTQAIVKMGYSKLTTAYNNAYLLVGDPEIGKIVFGFAYVWYLVTGTIIDRAVYKGMMDGFVADLQFEAKQIYAGQDMIQQHLLTPCKLRQAVMDHVLISAIEKGIHLCILALFYCMHAFDSLYIIGGLKHTKIPMCLQRVFFRRRLRL
jgi:hypothetical protein